MFWASSPADERAGVQDRRQGYAIDGAEAFGLVADLREAGADVLKGAAEVADPAGAGEPARGGRGLEVEAGRGRQALARLDARHHAGRTVLASVEVMVDCSRASATLAETAKSKKVVG